MQINSRTKNAKVNIYIGTLTQIITFLLSFISRKLFIQFLSVEYLGINGLYTNILSVLSLAELGLGSAVTFSLYKPVAEDNKPLIRGLVRYFRKLYRVVAFVITLFGLLLVPFLKHIITSDLPELDLIIYYLLFLASTVSTYFTTHNIALLSAYQENRVQKIVSLITALAQQVLHIFILLIWPNYMIYVASTIVCAILSNVFLNLITVKRHPFLRKGEIEKCDEQKEYIIKNIKSTSIYKLSTVTINSTDNILISVLVSTAAVGLYSNYVTVTTGIQAFISIITSAIMNGIGNMYAEENPKKLLSTFKVLILCYYFVGCFCAVSLFYLFNAFIEAWLGAEYILSKYVVFAIALNFFLTNITTPVWSFREATGQFVNTKYVMLVAAVLNLIISVILGMLQGVFGILMATVISKLLTMVWYEPKVLFKNVFCDKQNIYWKLQIRYVLCTLVCFMLCGAISKYMCSGIVSIIAFGCIFFLICSVVFVGANFKSTEIKDLKNLLIKKI